MDSVAYAPFVPIDLGGIYRAVADLDGFAH